MPALNFKKEFVADVEAGIKRMTIRAYRKDGRYPKPGQMLYHYTGMRTKACRKLREDICLKTTPIEITQAFDVTLDGKKLTPGAVMGLARADGFLNAIGFYNFFAKTHGFPFRGLVIEW